MEKNLVNTLETTVQIQSSSNLLKMIILTIYQSSSNLGHARSKTSSVGQIIEKPCEQSRCHNFGPIFIQLSQDRLWIITGPKLCQKVKS